MARFSVSQISSGANSRVIARASGYLDRVTITSMIPGQIIARARGTKQYQVTIAQSKNGQFTQHCTCPYGAPCKHTIATARIIARDINLRTYIEMSPQHSDSKHDLPTPDTIINIDHSDSSQPTLIDLLRTQIPQSQEVVSLPKPTRIERRAYYTVELYQKNSYYDSLTTELSMGIGVAKRKRGSDHDWDLGDTRNVRTLMNASPKYLTDIDHKLLSILSTLGNNYRSSSWNDISIDNLSLPEVLKYLRLSPLVYYRSGDGKGSTTLKPLKVRDPTELMISIQETDQGWQFVPNIDILHICDYDPGLILTADHQLVPIANDFYRPLLRTILSQPFLDQDSLDDPTTLETILQVQSHLPIQFPSSWQDKIKLTSPIPRLTAMTHSVGHWPTSIQFCYGQHSLDSQNTSQLYLSVDDQLIKRDLDQEQGYLREYQEHGSQIIDGAPHMARIATQLSEEWEIYLEKDGATKLSRGGFNLQLDSSSGIDWLDIDGEVTLDDHKYQLGELILASRGGTQIVQLGERSHLLPEELLVKLKKLAPLSDKKTGKVRLTRTQAGLVDSLSDLIDEGALSESWQQTLGAIRNYTGVAKVGKVKGLEAILRPYQKHGLNYLNYLSTTGFGGILADDMGLGKTVQAIAMLQHHFNTQKSLFALIVMPTSVVANWEAELTRFAPSLRVDRYTGSDRRLPSRGEAEIVLTTYALMRIDREELAKHDYDYLILDEAQYAKNIKSKTSQAARELRARHRLCLTGTPIENNLTELYSQLHFLNPGMLGTLQEFKHDLANPIEKHNNQERGEHLQRLIKPFILRRTKDQVLTDLPPKTVQTIKIEADSSQRKFYDSIKNYYQAKILNLVDKQGVARSQIQILEALLRLRQSCCDPRLIDSHTTASSAKLSEAIRLVTEAIAEGHKILLFSQFTSMIELIEQELVRRDIPYLTLTGSTPGHKRAKLIQSFQDSPKPLVFLLSLKAGGIGVNLTGADYVIHYDPWWNPAAESQATDRAHRIGQKKPVTVYKLIIKDSIEEKILALQDKKRDLIDSVILEGKVSKSLTRQDLEYLLG